MTRKNPLSLDLQQDTTPVPRRRFTQLAVAGAVGMALAACGGGSDSKSNANDQLLNAYNKLENGMSPDDATKLVGRPPDTTSGTSRTWRNGAETLDLIFNLKGGSQISAAYWFIGASREHSKIFSEV